MNEIEYLNCKKLNKKEKKLLEDEINLVTEKLNLYYDTWIKNRHNPIDLIMWFGRYIALERLFNINTVSEWKINNIHNFLLDFRGGIWEHYKNS